MMGSRRGGLPTAVVLAMVLAAILALSAGACSTGSGSPGFPGSSGSSAVGAAAVRLTVYGAASLKGVLEAAATAYAAAVPGTMLTISTDASSTLEAQIEQGAPADVFLAADTRSPQKLVDAGLAAGPIVPFAGNRLTIIVPVGNPAGVRNPADLARPGVKIIAAGDKVPVTTYATQLVDALAREPGYPSGFAAAYAANVVSREDNARAVVAKVALGEGDAGIVYVTDARTSTGVTTIDVPDRDNIAATYAGVVVKASPHLAAAEAFLAWLAGPGGRAILGAAGFLPVP